MNIIVLAIAATIWMTLLIAMPTLLFLIRITQRDQLLKSELVRKWIEALRSGKYQQGTMSLRSEFGYCCLVVLEDINRENSGFDWCQRYEEHGYYFISDEKDILTKLTASLLPKYIYQRELIHMNDTDGYSFDKIADYIENQVTTNNSVGLLKP